MVVYSALLLAVLVVGAPYWLVRMMTSGRYRAGLAGRLGLIPYDLRDAVDGRQVVWIHAVSVGEVMAATQLVRELRTALPGWVIAVSTTTATGQRLAQERLPESPVFYLPLDFGFVVRRYLQALHPNLLILMESELWPNLIDQCARLGVPMAVVNARISDRSLPRYMRLRRLWRPLLAKISLYLAQSEENAARWVRIGAPADRVRVSGNLKYDIKAAGASSLVKPLREHLPENALVVGLSGIANHDNIGGIFRNSAAFGVDGVLIDAASCDPLYRKAIRVSVGAALRVPFARLAPGEDMVGVLEAAGFVPLALTPGGSEPLTALTRPPRAALLLGAEGPGLPADILARARRVSIPMAAGWDSLNVGAASAVALHELTRG